MIVAPPRVPRARFAHGVASSFRAASALLSLVLALSCTDSSQPAAPRVAPDTPRRFLAPTSGYTYVSAGAGVTCAVKADGTLRCWGTNGVGLASPPPGTFSALSVGFSQACGVRTDGTLGCWGEDWSG